jgi:hypothetical protein
LSGVLDDLESLPHLLEEGDLDLEFPPLPLWNGNFITFYISAESYKQK